MTVRFGGFSQNNFVKTCPSPVGENAQFGSGPEHISSKHLYFGRETANMGLYSPSQTYSGCNVAAYILLRLYKHVKLSVQTTFSIQGEG